MLSIITVNQSVATLLRRLGRILTDALFGLLLLGCVIAGGWLVARHDVSWDWTHSGSQQLTAESRAILQRLDAPVRLTVFADPASPLARMIGQLLERYTQARADLEIHYRDPRRFPEQAREAEVSLQGQILLEYRGRRETLAEVSERTISAALARLAQPRQAWVAVLEGHGERAIDGDRPDDFGRLGAELRELGLIARPLDLATVGAVPENTRLVILSQPRLPLFPGESDALIAFLERGGHLLWLLDPGPPVGLEPLLTQLGITPLPGQVAEPAALERGLETAAVALLDSYPVHPLTADLSTAAVLPGALAFATEVAPGWMLATYLNSSATSWNETGTLAAPLTQDEVIGERTGPLPVVLALTRSLSDGAAEQRVVIVGDGDFLTNAQLDYAGNRALGLALIRWLSTGEDLPTLPPLLTAAEPLELDDTQRTLLGAGTLALLPGLFLLLGLGIRWWRWRVPE